MLGGRTGFTAEKCPERSVLLASERRHIDLKASEEVFTITINSGTKI
jgi:hypothetical protein